MSAAPKETTPVGTAPNGDLLILSTLNDDGSRRWLRPRPSPGRFWHARRAVAYFLIAIFTAIPYLTINDKPAVLLDIIARRFTIFGYTFLPTDTLLLALTLLIIGIGIFLFTAIFGRVWCGWGCPQTVYMEFVFRPIERLFEGTPGRAKKTWLQNSPARKFIKLGVYFLISCYLAHTFLAYFVGVEQLRVWVTRSPAEHPTSFAVMAIVTALMMFDFAFFREQTCLVVCPYGRFQSALIDRQSLIVAYDKSRGEPRGKKAARPGDVSLKVIGDCVDCGLCVQTCPTGIDIRNGLQMECVHCTQCIDACDAVMAKLKRPAGLIRYASQSEIAGEPRRWFRPRIVVYPLIITVLITAFTIVLLTRTPFNATILRTRGAPFLELPDGTIGNNARLKLVNREDRTVSLQVAPLDGAGLRIEASGFTLAPGELREFPVVISAPRHKFNMGKSTASLRITDDKNTTLVRTFQLVGPGSMHDAAKAEETKREHANDEDTKGESGHEPQKHDDSTKPKEQPHP
ncbi:MAG: cytochrome c oxidase accessory protein CcoG [Phycisphaerae bacterium]|nr:cytochrome c oxidase accessory protein CcoG [Phycisphaerae bacterium]